tara:strand:+ start:275 stop:643 length:369 start_codon:yes stop_codon:yes gene_type:complete
MMECYQCKKETDDWDDATKLHAIAWNEPLTVFLYKKKCIRCSPSRAQHIVHPDFEPVADDRPMFDKRLWSDPENAAHKKYGPNFATECEDRYTNAWLELREECEEENSRKTSIESNGKTPIK